MKNTARLMVMAVFCISALVTVLTLMGCSPQERSGVSRLPQNRPSAWEYQGAYR